MNWTAALNDVSSALDSKDRIFLFSPALLSS